MRLPTKWWMIRKLLSLATSLVFLGIFIGLLYHGYDEHLRKTNPTAATKKYHKEYLSLKLNTDERYDKDPVKYPRTTGGFSVKINKVIHSKKSKRREKLKSLEVKCPLVLEENADINTAKVYEKFQFNPTPGKDIFWDDNLESRYHSNQTHQPQHLLQVYVVPHSHNDPGWRETFEDYYEWHTKHIIHNIIEKLNQYPDMTFVWSEVTFLQNWWKNAYPSEQKALKKLVAEGRLEITTGGWVMPDEACTHIYSLLDQYIEGHEWLKVNLGIKPKTGWSVDPFGHGATVPYLLNQSGIKATIIQRIHYKWKKYFAKQQIQEFHWIQNWSKRSSLLTHNLPMDIYSVEHSCGPQKNVCSNYEFSLSKVSEPVTDANVHSKAKELVEQYRRIGSLTVHNVVLVPLGDDFAYAKPRHIDYQYRNYSKLFDYINHHQDIFNVHVQFGTPSNYFKVVNERFVKAMTLKGDFFPYADIFTNGKPAYWSGYYTTRPYFKILVRLLEHHFRTSELLFTLTFNSLNNRDQTIFKIMESSYSKLVSVRRNLAVFQHHDAVTGTAIERVMDNYATILLNSLYNCMRLQELALSLAMISNSAVHFQTILEGNIKFDKNGNAKTRCLKISMSAQERIVLFNPLGSETTEIINLIIDTSMVSVFDNYNQIFVQTQITPIIELNENIVISETSFELSFVAKLPALTAVTFTLAHTEYDASPIHIVCTKCISKSKNINLTKPPATNIILENRNLILEIDRATGFLSKIIKKNENKEYIVKIQFGAYKSAMLESGAYLFKPNPQEREFPVLKKYLNYSHLNNDNIIIKSGPISQEITLVYLPFLTHKVTLYNVDDDILSQSIKIENYVDFGAPPENRETELFMRIDTNVLDGDTNKSDFYTDQNGFQYMRRVKQDKLGIEGNYYPITTMAWIQNKTTRMTYVTDHAQGASSYVPGRLEVMLDRQMVYDDERGLGEGIYDNKPVNLRSWLIFESVSTSFQLLYKKYQMPSRDVAFLSKNINYPVNIYRVDDNSRQVKPYTKFAENFPENLHLMTLRTISDADVDHLPSSSCYMILQRTGFACRVGRRQAFNQSISFSPRFKFNNVDIVNVSAVSLTGLDIRNNIALQNIRLRSMEIKSFRMQFSKEKNK